MRADEQIESVGWASHLLLHDCAHVRRMRSASGCAPRRTAVRRQLEIEIAQPTPCCNWRDCHIGPVAAVVSHTAGGKLLLCSVRHPSLAQLRKPHLVKASASPSIGMMLLRPVQVGVHLMQPEPQTKLCMQLAMEADPAHHLSFFATASLRRTCTAVCDRPPPSGASCCIERRRCQYQRSSSR